MAQREQLLQKFEQEYARLNERQRAAVDQIEGPVMVIAGPGTGKTQILAARIGKILLDTDVDPYNILCLTYTDAGAIAMRRRLTEFIGPDAYKVHISTFHAFCNEVIQEHLNLFEKTSMDPLSDIEKISYMKELVDDLPGNHLLKRYRGDVYYEIPHLLSLFSTLKREGWELNSLNLAIDSYLSELPTREGYFYKKAYREFKAGDPNMNKIGPEKERMEKLKSAIALFPKYQQLLRKYSRYDFDDMITWVINMFREHPAVLLEYQERFQYVLVDEYQDTSGSQNMLVSLLISYWDRPNVFVVGDDDQSIFRFQGANVENMQKFADDFQADLKRVVLSQNYRSTQPILDLSKDLISRNKERLIHKLDGLTKELISSRPGVMELNHMPQIHVYDSQRHEMMGISQSIARLLQEGVAPGRIAVIYKENRYGEQLSEYFRMLAVPFYTRRQLNLLELPVPEKIIEFLHYLAAEHYIPFSGDEMLFRILHFDWWGIQPIEIARLSIETAQMERSDTRSRLRSMLNFKATENKRDLFHQALSPQLVKAALLIEELIAIVPNVTLQQLFELIIRKTGCLSAVINSDNKHWGIRQLTGLFDFIKEETRRNSQLDLKGLSELFHLMRQENIRLPLVQINGNEGGVNLLTAHGSKGLEFTYVFLAGTNSACWEKKDVRNNGFRFPETVIHNTASKTDHEELRRLFYVALTRAEQYLFISYARCRDDGKELEPSQFIAELRENFSLEPMVTSIPDEDMLAFDTMQLNAELAPEIEKLEADFTGRLLERFTLSATALNNFLACPLQFYYVHLVRIPSPRNENTEFGSAIHFALEKLFRRMQDAGEFGSVEALLADFQWWMNRHKESFTQSQFNRRMEHGEIVLPQYFNHYKDQWHRIVAVERSIGRVVIDGVPIKGKVDKLEFHGNQVNLVDYKTGDGEKAGKKMKGPDEKNPNGGDYWRQAAFYKLLVDNQPSTNWEVTSMEFDFIEPLKNKTWFKKRIDIKAQDLTTVKEQIKSVWARIQAQDFYVGCGKKDCNWCNFVKSNDLAVELHETEAETGEIALDADA